MVLRFQLVHAQLGSLVISEPGGFKDIIPKLSRNLENNFHSLWETWDGEFEFYGDNGVINGGVDRIRQAINLYGPDTTLEFVADIALDGYSFQNFIRGQLALDGIQETEDNTAILPIIKTDFTTKFKNRYETPVDIESEENLDGTTADVFPPIDLDLPSQKIPKTTSYEGSILFGTDDVEVDITPTVEEIDADGASMVRTYYTQGQVNIEQDEISESFDTLLDFVTAVIDISPSVEMDDESGDTLVTVQPGQTVINFDGFLFAESDEADPSVVQSISILATTYLQRNDETPILIGSPVADIESGGYTTPTTGGGDVHIVRGFTLNHTGGTQTISVESGDTLKVYIEFRLEFIIDVGVDDGAISWSQRLLRIISHTYDMSYVIQSVFPDSNTEAFLLHDAAGQILDRITGEDQCFYSKILGSDRTLYRQYEADGCQWRRALVKGLQLRNYSLFEKHFFLSFKQWWEGINPILNLGLGYEKLNGQDIIRVESVEHFYNPEIIVRINNVRQITKSFDADQMVKTVRIGYKKWQSDNISGIDDAQTKHTYASRLQKFGKEVTIESEFIAASLAIETTRRTTRKKSADYKYDDDTFIIALAAHGGSPDTTYIPERDELFSSITNLQNADTRYNSIFTPARNFMRWAKLLFGGLQHYVGSVFKFTSGEGNYDMTSNYQVSDGCNEYNEDLSEKQNIEVTDDYIHRGELCEIVVPMEIEDYLTIKANPKNAIGISQTTKGHAAFFIKELSKPLYGEATIQAWPLLNFQIQVIESEITQQVCEASEDVCEDAYLTQDSDEYITQGGDCLVLQ